LSPILLEEERSAWRASLAYGEREWAGETEAPAQAIETSAFAGQDRRASNPPESTLIRNPRRIVTPSMEGAPTSLRDVA
jgi:hypothetical protein